MLVAAWPLYRPPLALAERPELAAAFARGERERGGPGDPSAREYVEGLTRDEMTAYFQGVHGPKTPEAPAPLIVDVLALAATLATDAVTHADGPLRSRVARTAVGLGTYALLDRVRSREQRRRGRALGLTPATEPLPTGVGVVFASFLLEWLDQVRLRLRTGRWPRTDPASNVAAAAARMVIRRREWNAAYAARPT